MQNLNSIANAISQKSSKGFASKLPYSIGMSIFPWVWDLETEACIESELFWKDLSLVNQCFFESHKSTQTETQSLHQSYKENKKREQADFKSAAELLEENEAKNGSGLRKIVTKKSKFISPLLRSNEAKDNEGKDNKENLDDRLKNVDPNMVTMIKNEVSIMTKIQIMDKSHPVAWEDIAGLEHAKKSIKEIVVWPMLRPDLFNGIRGPPKGLLLFGPPGKHD
jgi:SpoVK/Ycf46/Vps4 family AAA+-type ATPase